MIEIVIEARKAAISPTMQVKRILPFRKKRMVGPFIFMDHGGPIALPPQSASSLDVLPHPHIGLSTVTYLLSGNVTHRDSLGVNQVIRPGEVNWMTAGKGIAHSERFEDPATLANGGLEMLQTWVALPEQFEESDPTFNNYKPEALPVFTDTGLWMRLIAGHAYGERSAVKTLSPLFYIHASLDKGGKLNLPDGHQERAVYIVSGELEISGNTYAAGQMIVFDTNADPVIIAKENSTLMMLGGEPVGERFIWWNFVSSRKERIKEAKSDWKEGRIKLPPDDNAEYIALPEAKLVPSPPSAEPLS